MADRAAGGGRFHARDRPERSLNVVEATLRRVVADLGSLDAPWALVGGFAVSALAEPRFTRDVDIVVAVGTDAEAESLVHALARAGYTTRTTVDHDISGRLAMVRLQAPAPLPLLVDLRFASSGIEPELVAGAEVLDVLPDLDVPVVSRAGLVVTKLLARDDASRPQDAADLLALRGGLTADDLEEARRLAALVTARGYSRGRDLIAMVDQLGDT